MSVFITHLSCVAFGDACLATGPKSCQNRPGATSFRVVAYLPDYAMTTVPPKAFDLITDLVFFSAVIDQDGAFPITTLSALPVAAVQQIKREHALRTHLCFGGWGRSDGFAVLSLDPGKRKAFIEALTAYCTANAFDGVDYDWEFPANREERAAYNALLTETAAAFHPKGLEVSIALGWSETLDAAAYTAVDRIHLMTYDMGKRHSTYAASKAAVGRVIASGAPAAKICLGVPFYGRKMDQLDTAMAYKNILSEFAPGTRADEAGGFYFNNAATLRKKTHYATHKGLAGMMIWEISMDTGDETSLLQAIQKEIAKNRR